MFALPIRPDFRRPADPDERAATCRRCGMHLVVLRDDRRLGFCFDCYDPSEVRATFY